MITKSWIVATHSDAPLQIIGHDVEFRVARNSGGAFSTFTNATVVLAVLAIGLTIWLVRTLRRTTGVPDVVPDVWIWADSFTDHFFPANALAAIRFLESAGVTARVIRDDACCGLTWVTTGQLDEARAIMTKTARTLRPYVESGVPVVGLEPSCLATLRSDVPEMVGEHLDVLTFAELLERLDVALPSLGLTIPHAEIFSRE